MIDQSGSMSDPWTEPTRSKAQALADSINRLLQNLVIKCAKSEGVRDYFHVGVIGYGGSVGPAFGGALATRELAPISEIAANPLRIDEKTKKVEDGAGGLVDQTIRFPIWFEPLAQNGTPMCQALFLANKIVSGWLADHPACFPPTVIHLTDGESTDGDATEAMRNLTNLSSNDGNVVLFNLHVSSSPAVVAFPDSPAGLPDAYAQMLFGCASKLTPFMRQIARDTYGLQLRDDARAFVLNGDPTLVVQALDIGTRPSNLR
jgi:hypothetical protein